MDQILSKDKIDDFKVTFQKYDEQANGRIKWTKLEQALKDAGFTVTEAEMEEFKQEFSPDGQPEEIEFPEFLTLITQQMRDQDSLQELIEAFQVVDNDLDGLIPTNELRYMMLNMGDKLSQQEVEEMIKQSDPQNQGFIKYADYAKIMIDKLGFSQ